MRDHEHYPRHERHHPSRWAFVLALLAIVGCGVEDPNGGGGNGGSGGSGGTGGVSSATADVLPGDDSVNAGEIARNFGDDGSANVIAPPANAQACTADNQCATGYCMDGFCCDSRCDNKCMACSAAKKGGGVDGVCGSIKYDTDPDNDCPVGACDGKNACKNYNGVPCTASPQCLSNYCVDGYCCGNICMGACQACSAAKKGSGVNGVCGNIANTTDPDNECNPGECNGSGACNSSPQPTLANGAACTSAAQCASGFCADGVCCNSWCLGTCQACTAAKKNQGVDGVCGPIANDKDPDEECWGGSCDGNNTCKQYNGVPCTDKAQCLSGYCVDGFCCGNICNTQCFACSVAKKGQGYDGVCGPIAAGRDIESECNPGECNGSGGCNQPQSPQANGTVCVSGGQCASGNCVDGVCCDTACTSNCMACTSAKKGSGPDGVCGNIGSELDPDKECNGGRCDGKGVCRFYNGAPCSSTGQCFSNYCVDGFCCGNICTGACQACSNAKKGSGFDGVCGPVANATDPDNECNPGECNGANACNQPQAQQPNGATCSLATQCLSGFCVDGVCCDTACPLTCEACTAAKKGQGTNGTCGPIKINTDPDNECLNADCNGAGACTTPTNLPNGTACTAGTQCASLNCVDGVCCDTVCSGVCVACSATKKGQGTDGTCGPIKYDTDPEDECYGGGCNGSGACGYYNGVACSAGTQCLSTYCADGFCCNNHCGGTCYACSTAKKGSGYDGICSFVKTNTDPDDECNPGACNGAGVCYVPPCTSNADCGTNATCSNSTCTCDAGYSGDGFNCTDIDECATNNGGCDANATCTNTVGSRTCACNMGYTGDGITCTDFDECTVNNGGCDPNATCTNNTQGPPTCTCNMGYTGDGTTCTFTGQIVNLAMGANSVCARANDNRVKCWGRNLGGALGTGDSNTRGDDPQEMGGYLPVVNVGSGRFAVKMSIGLLHACAVLDNGSLKCWGNNGAGQLGLENMISLGDEPNEMGDNLPMVNLGTGKTAVQISTAPLGHFSCAVLNDGNAKCWGANTYGQLGQGDTISRGDNPGEMGDNLLAIRLGTGRTVTAIAVGGLAACAILDNGSLKCWGSNGWGRLGYGDPYNRGEYVAQMGDNLPAVNLGTGYTVIAVGQSGNHNCAILNGGIVKCWGLNGFGNLGVGDTIDRGSSAGDMGDNLPPAPLGTGKTAIAIAVGGAHTCALLNDGSVKCWGDNFYGQLGLGDTIGRGDNPGEMGDNLPAVNLGTGKTAIAIGAGGSTSCALLNDGKLKCWGHNSYGELGQGDTVNRGDNPGEMGDALPYVQPF